MKKIAKETFETAAIGRRLALSGALALTGGSLVAGLAQAQEAGRGEAATQLRRRMIRELQLAGGPGGPADHSMAFSFFGDAAAGKTMKGAPFSATAVTEVDQPLADGNRIRQKSSGALARDSAGRTRREHTPGAVGPLVLAGEAPRLVHLHDPSTGVSVTLDESRRKAFKMTRNGASEGPPPPPFPSPPPGGARFELALPPPPPPAPGEKGRLVEDDVFVLGAKVHGAGFPGPHAALRAALPLLDVLPDDAPRPAEEDLGSQVIEGVKANGKRTTITIPTGKIGNERPIAIVSERWFSPELGLTVLSRHSDPRLGTTTYRLTGLERREPPAALFEVPAGYTVEDGPVLIRKLRRGEPASK